MKRMLVISIVLLAGFIPFSAFGAITMWPSANPVTVDSTITISGTSDSLESYFVYLELVNPGTTAEWYSDVRYPGFPIIPPPEWPPYPDGFVPINVTNPQPGIQWSIDLHCLALGDAIIHLDDSTTFDIITTLTIHQVPEPMTIALLSLGGLLLRRRR
jgi:hypothetical protein